MKVDLRKNEAKLYIRVTRDFDKKVTSWAGRLGITKSQLGNICMQAGLSAVVKAIAPEEAFSPELLASIIKAAEDKGVVVQMEGLKQAQGGD